MSDSAPPIRLTRARDIDHFALIVADIGRTVEFYERVLGMRAVEFEFRGRRRTALRFGEHKRNLHEPGTAEAPMPRVAQPGSVDLCLLVDDPVERIAEELSHLGVEIVHGPDRADGATGELNSVWVRDPDGNLIELANRTER